MLRAVLLQMAHSHALARMVTSNRATSRMALRFVAGETLDAAAAAARKLNQTGRMASLDHLGESVTNEEEARAAAEACLKILDRIHADGLDSNISIKLTQMGLDIGTNLCESLASSIVARAENLGNFVRVDMEGSPYTQRTLELVKRLRAKSEAVGTVLQAYLYRTEHDARELVAAGCRIRLCKGAYREPEDIAFPSKADVDENYVKVMQILLVSGIYHGIATHDPMMISATKAFATQRRIGRDKFEFQMLYGVRTDLQEQLMREGYRLRVYIPFGNDWFPYFMRRLAERPANVGFFLRQLMHR
jgi:proline dehydrogenase